MHFPIVFSLKVVGEVDSNLESIIVAALQKNEIDIEHVRISARLSKAGKYTSLTATFMAMSQEQLDNIYREISGNPKVIIVL